MFFNVICCELYGFSDKQTVYENKKLVFFIKVTYVIKAYTMFYKFAKSVHVSMVRPTLICLVGPTPSNASVCQC